MAQFFYLQIPQWNKGSTVLAGGTVNFFVASSSTPQNVYSDSTGNTSLGSVVTLDANGQAQIWLAAAAYKIILKDSAGVTVLTVDNFNPTNVNTTVTSLTDTGDLTMQQSTAATSGANQSSKTLKIQGNYWNGSASATDEWDIQNVQGSGTNPTSSLTVTHSGSSGTPSVSVPSANISLGGQVSFGGGEIWVPVGGSIQTAINSITTGVVRLEAGIYALGNTGITLKSGVQLIGANESSSIITYTGTGAAVTMDSTTEAAVRRVQIQIGSSATAIGLDVQNTTADSKFNTIENVQIQTTGGTFTSGQIGFRYMCSTTFALYWNTMIACQTVKLDTGFMLTNSGAFSTNGCNDNKFYSISAHFFTTGMLINKFATENQIYGLTGSASGQVANNTLLQIGNSSNAAHGNMIYGLVADTGTAGQAYVITSGVNYTYLSGVYDTAGRASTDAGTGTIINGFRNASSQANLLPTGTAGNPPLGFLIAPTSGLFISSGGVPEVSTLGTAHVAFGTAGPRLGSGDAFAWASAGDPNGTTDTGIGRNAAGIVSADTTAAGNALGKFKAAVFIPQGSTSQKAESAADTNVLTFTPPAVAGTYRLRFTLSLSAASAAVLGWTATWKDANGNAKSPTNLSLYQVGTAAPALTFTTSTATDEFYGDATIDTDNSATNIVIKLTLGSGTFTGKASATVERLI